MKTFAVVIQAQKDDSCFVGQGRAGQVGDDKVKKRQACSQERRKIEADDDQKVY